MFLCRRRFLNAYFTERPPLLLPSIRYFASKKRAGIGINEDDPFDVPRSVGNKRPSLRSSLDHTSLLNRLGTAVQVTKETEAELELRRAPSSEEVKSVREKPRPGTTVSPLPLGRSGSVDEQPFKISVARNGLSEHEKAALQNPRAPASNSELELGVNGLPKEFSGHRDSQRTASNLHLAQIPPPAQRTAIKVTRDSQKTASNMHLAQRPPQTQRTAIKVTKKEEVGPRRAGSNKEVKGVQEKRQPSNTIRPIPHGPSSGVDEQPSKVSVVRNGLSEQERAATQTSRTPASGSERELGVDGLSKEPAGQRASQRTTSNLHLAPIRSKAQAKSYGLAPGSGLRPAQQAAGVPHFSIDDLTSGPNKEENSLHLYLHYHGNDPQKLSSFPARAFFNAGQRASYLGQLDALDNIARDLLQFYRGEAGEADNEQRCNALAEFLTLFSGDGFLKDTTVLAMFDACVECGGSNLSFSVSPKMLDRITEALIETHIKQPLGSVYAPTAQRFVNVLISAVRMVPTTKRRAFRSEPPDLAAKLFRLILAYIIADHHDVALDIFQRLVDLSLIPMEAITYAEELYESSKDFRLIVLSALVKTCLKWNWPRQAVPLATYLIESYSVLIEEIKVITELLLESLLEDRTLRSLKQAQLLASLFVTRTSTDVLLPDSFVSGIYKRSFELKNEPRDKTFGVDAGDIAEAMYDMTQRSKNVEKHVYPPPDGSTVLWFLGHLTHKSNNQGLARQLVQQYIDGPVDLPAEARGDMVYLAALNGFGTAARTLWERYAGEGLSQIAPAQTSSSQEIQDKRLVTGHAGASVRMVSMFTSFAEREIARVQSLEQIIADQMKSSLAQPAPEQVRSRLMTVQEELDYHRQRSDDFNAFARLVATRFRESIEPLKTADHRHLNALARIHFMLGEINTGFTAFKVMIDRYEIPDHYDINVSLSVLVQHDARAAGSIIKAMVQKGLQPSDVALGTVLNAAMAHGDSELVDWLLHFAQKQGINITMKSLAAGVHTSLTQGMGKDSRARRRENLEIMLNIVRANTEERYLPTVSIGKMCVNAAVDVGSAELAFDFWRMLLWKRADWDDLQQRQLRSMIAVQARKEVRSGSLETDAAREMVDTLGLVDFDVGVYHPWTIMDRPG
ncbi:hypothetical protein OE88DRAFT_1657303 [Heliocybe sulcata]|uniref:Pentacotripeptide-repeat region of PRORP domain-containing protein n=1 Tax=Heliocybe sulcata TaxID=5364 RepID=A0A5C3N586_9AGAM|nr:hypothetical protein OE88DRAFT_1657303 [Heliocybe sulcata]